MLFYVLNKFLANNLIDNSLAHNILKKKFIFTETNINHRKLIALSKFWLMNEY
jgi:hypothetical protein